MKKSKLYLFVIFGLLLTNILIGYYFYKSNKHKRPKPREIVIERLNFDENQIVQYDKVIQQHQKLIMEKKETMGRLKKTLYVSLKNERDTILTDSLVKEIGITQEEIEYIHYSHFENIKKLCDKNQLESFNNLVNDLALLFSPVTMKKNERREQEDNKLPY